MASGTSLSERNQILVVEDDALVSDVISAALDDSYTTVIVEDADAALALLRQGNIRLVLLDCTLPGGVTPELLPEADRQGTPVILMSGDPDRMKQVTDEPRPFIRKPFTLAGLLGTVETIIQQPS
jgi:DNA-binding NtrC family response regulator